MDGRNSSGARVSLLNDSPAVRPKLKGASCGAEGHHSYSHGHSHGHGHSLPSLYGARPQLRSATSLAVTHSRTSSFASTPVLSSPSTPQLVRSDSSDSAMMNRTPSPVTPVGLGFDALSVSHAQDPVALHFAQPATHQFAAANFFAPPAQPQQKGPPSQYPPISQHHALPFAYPAHPAAAQLVFPPAGAQQQQQQQPPQLPLQPHQPQLLPGEPSAAVNPASTAGSNASKAPSKKNHYPCPLAKEYNCNNFFTTSGHAARHAKKHTGKKDAFCPECNKAFTRKDNMEQHRRTHQNGRNPAKSTNGEAPAKRQKTASSSSSSQPKRQKPTPLEAPVPTIDPSLPVSPASSFGFSDAAGLGLPVQPAPQVYPADLLQQGSFGQATPYPAVPYFDSSSMSGLDKLAMAASGETSRQNSGSL